MRERARERVGEKDMQNDRSVERESQKENSLKREEEKDIGNYKGQRKRQAG